MNSPRLVIVEDEVIVGMDIKNRLTMMGYEVMGLVPNGERALAFLEGARPNLILMDIRLEGAMDGITTAEQINKRHRLPVVFLTAYSEDATLQRAKLARPFGYILKPFEDQE